MKQRIAVSPEMLAFVGPGPVCPQSWPAQPILFRFFGLDGAQAPSLAIAPADADEADVADTLVLIVAAAACRRIFGSAPDRPGRWRLPADLRDMVVAIRDCAGATALRETRQLARSIELVCCVFDHLDMLVPSPGPDPLPAQDGARVAAARRLIEARWHEKLTLDGIARACGLSRGKLARDFRLAYDCSVGDAIADRRVAGARQMLRDTDLPIKAIGYRCGYMNNASFTRAFSRHVGVAPNRFRTGAMAR